MPVLGLIFLRHATNRFETVKAEIEQALPKRGGKTREIEIKDFKGKAALFLPETARYDYLLGLPEKVDLGTAINDAMRAIAQLPEAVKPMQESVEWLAERLQQFVEEITQPKNTVQMNLFEDVPEAEINEHLAGLREVLQELTSVQQRCRVDGQILMADLAALEMPEEKTNAAQIDCTQAFEPFISRLKAHRKEIDELHKLLNRGLDVPTKKLKASKLKSWKTREISDRTKQLDTEHEGARDAIKMIRYWYEQAHWLQSRFPEAVFVDVPGLCRGVIRAEIAEQDSSLTPGRYVGVAPVVDDEDEEAFEDRMKTIHQDLAELNEEAVELAGAIQSNFEELLG